MFWNSASARTMMSCPTFSSMESFFSVFCAHLSPSLVSWTAPDSFTFSLSLSLSAAKERSEGHTTSSNTSRLSMVGIYQTGECFERRKNLTVHAADGALAAVLGTRARFLASFSGPAVCDASILHNTYPVSAHSEKVWSVCQQKVR